MEQNQERINNQKEFRAILVKYGITQAKAAELITKETYRAVNARTVRAWLANEEAISALPCPLWAVVSLKKATSCLPIIQKEDPKNCA
ncbi:MAG: hypothetical protein PHC94_02830 [Methylobacter sp.]|nr:hypothetical protein [Methylobacter sp.]